MRKRCSSGLWFASALPPDACASTAFAGGEGEPEWLTAAAKFLPEGYVFGQVIATAADGRGVTVAVFPEGANAPHRRGAHSRRGMNWR